MPDFHVEEMQMIVDEFTNLDQLINVLPSVKLLYSLPSSAKLSRIVWRHSAIQERQTHSSIQYIPGYVEMIYDLEHGTLRFTQTHRYRSQYIHLHRSEARLLSDGSVTCTFELSGMVHVELIESSGRLFWLASDVLSAEQMVDMLMSI
jgi:hypothetical protein